ncbi:NAD(P)/FAD-dependent oxidoreductase [Variovorax sp. Sphag1AA]|uniref:NAD(P)/FAD-dependent oxidoreductase n=1 Tax=Variovorax sp. Sphag1AA TaxID=2587027 RepID=UPI0016116B70|nr:NAD(P)/FAD-dependent oxidoreductase [Variovorax sp. Sphag1AA]MBB3180455.1 putative flavoprotein involved in K+ transport [Variovorax sp. Sphag1AA]
MTDLSAHPTQIASAWLADFNSALERQDIDAAVALFDADSYWRDLVAFTWNIRTQEGPDAIRAMLNARLAETKPSGFAIEGDATEADGIVDAWFTFETAVARGRGHLRLRNGKAWTLLTTMTELKGFEERKGERRIKGAEHGVNTQRKTWREKRDDEAKTLGFTEQPYVLIVGGGQGGIALGARLRRLGVPTIIVEKNARPGDSWRKRYKSLCLHDPVWYDHLPYLPFPDDWPVFSPKDKIGDWLEMYTKVMELNYWGSTTAKKARYDDAKKEWEVTVERDGKEIVLRPKQLVFALGVSGYPNVPKIPGAETFEGEQHHSSAHPGPEAWRGKKCVVLGSNNSAHDICAALWENGADVTMIQRSSTHIAPSDSLMELALGGLYSEAAVKAGVTTDKADLIFASIPYKIMAPLQVPVYDEMKKRDADLYSRLEKAGFLLDFGVDGSGLFMKYLRRGSGYYIDVGASELVANGSVKLKSGVTIERINPRSVTLSDGTELPADLIVYATGYGSMNGWLADLISPELADKVGKVWGLGSDTPKDPGPWEGELRNMWKPTQVPQLWFHGGNLHQSRHYSQFLSLQLKARMEGLSTPVYELAPSHHTR